MELIILVIFGEPFNHLVMNMKEEYTYKRKQEIFKEFPKVPEKFLRNLINETISTVSGVSLKEAKDRKVVFPKEVEIIYKELE